EGAQTVSYEEIARHQRQVALIAGNNPNVESYMSSVGSGNFNKGGNSGRIFMHLKPKATRKQHVSEIIQDLRKEYGKIPGIKVYLQNPPALRMGGQLTKA